jgi:hypothetical protein
VLYSHVTWERSHPHRRAALPEDQQGSALGHANCPARAPAEAGDRDSAASVSWVRRPQQDDAPTVALHNDDLTPLDADRVVGQMIAKVANADSCRHAARLGLCVRSVNRIAYASW